MSDKYCPVGKRECKRFSNELFFGKHEPFCEVEERFIRLRRYTQCPWPSHQMPVKKDALDARNEGFAAGRLAGLREAREAVKKLTRKMGAFTEFEVDEDMLLAAIDRLMGGK